MGTARGEVWRFTMRGSHAAPAELCAAVGPRDSATAVTALLVRWRLHGGLRARSASAASDDGCWRYHSFKQGV